MCIREDRELEALRAAGRIVRLALEAMRAAVAPGVTTATLDALAGDVLRAQGARSAPRLVYQFPGETCISPLMLLTSPARSSARGCASAIWPPG